MSHSLKHLGKSEAEIQELEYSQLRAKLNRDDSFPDPVKRTEAANRLKELRVVLMRRYLDSRGL